MTQRVQIIDGILSKERCSQLIEKLEDSPLLQAERNGANYYRSVFFDEHLAKELEQAISRYVPRDIKATRLSDRFRFSKYNPGGKFSLHQDGIYQDPRTGERSAYTLSIFLNDEFSGGETAFFDGDNMIEAESNRNNPLTTKPVIGRGVLFPREVYHCGNEVENGYKYLLRTDVMVSI